MRFYKSYVGGTEEAVLKNIYTNEILVSIFLYKVK